MSKIDSARSYMRFAGMAMQMAVLITAAAFLGRWLDGYFDTGKALTAALSLLGVFLALFYFIRQSNSVR